jgi:hypothetical protein
MTNREIEKSKQELCDIQRISDIKKKWEKLKVLAEKINAPIPPGLHEVFTIDSINEITRNIHDSLQTEMMLSACISAEQSSIKAKWACIWAAVAAIATCISVGLLLFLR